jgi:hypothetical protein
MLSDIFTPPTAITPALAAAFAGCRFHMAFLADSFHFRHASSCRHYAYFITFDTVLFIALTLIIFD